jgi:hypothetical protein
MLSRLRKPQTNKSATVHRRLRHRNNALGARRFCKRLMVFAKMNQGLSGKLPFLRLTETSTFTRKHRLLEEEGWLS